MYGGMMWTSDRKGLVNVNASKNHGTLENQEGFDSQQLLNLSYLIIHIEEGHRFDFLSSVSGASQLASQSVDYKNAKKVKK